MRRLFFLETRRRPKSIAGSYNPRHPKPLLGWELRSSHEALASSALIQFEIRGVPPVFEHHPRVGNVIGLVGLVA